MAGLGRGLGSLIPAKSSPINKDASTSTTPSAFVDLERVSRINPDEIRANPKQPRHYFNEQGLDDLATSIKEHGILQPLIVTRTSDGYELIAGERRLRAAKKLGLKEVPAIIRRADDQKKLEWAIIENIQRSDLNPVELAESYHQLSEEFNLSQEELAKSLGKARSTIANTLRILKLPAEIQKAIAEGAISEGHAKVLLGLDTEVKQQVLFKKIIANQLSVDDTKEETRKVGGTKQAPVTTSQADKVKELALSRWFGSKVSLKRAKQGGQIIIKFSDDEELGEVMRKVS
jgi:ParB family chromosome partitioning protein